MKITIAYSDAVEREVLEAVFGSEGSEIVGDLIQVSEEKLKFETEKFDLFYISPTQLFQGNVKFLTSLARVEKGLKAIRVPEGQYVVKSSMSLEYCVLRGKKAKVTVGLKEGQEVDITGSWIETCGDVPAVTKVLASVRLSDDDMRRVKAFIRKRLNSIQLPENFVKELGRSTEKIILCVKTLCQDAGLPILGTPVPF